MYWKGHQQRKEVWPRERQDPTTNVEGREQRKDLWKSKQAKGQPSQVKGKGKSKNRKGFTRGESNKDWKSVR